MTSNAPLVTVYVVNHNYGRFVADAIDSVLNQTLQDFEVLVIDDGSTDNSRDVIARYSENPKITVVLQENRGLNVTNNIALHAARGRYIMRLDADDWLDPHALEIMSGMLERDSQIGLVFPDYYHVDEHGSVLEMVRRHDFRDVTLLDQPAHGACTMIRRQCLLCLDGYDESFRCQDGYELWIRFIEHYTVRNINLPLFYYRQHQSSLTRNEERILSTRSDVLRRAAERQAKGVSRASFAVAIIPVRGHSLEPSSFPLRPLAGKPLLYWSIDATLDAKRVGTVIVTSPDGELLSAVSSAYGRRVHCVRRERALAMPNTFIEQTLLHALREDQVDASHDVVAVLQTEWPFRKGRHIDSAIDVMRLFETDSVIAVRPETDNFYRHNGSGLVPLRSSPALRLERDDLYRETGAMRIAPRRRLESDGRLVEGRVGHLVLDRAAAFGIHSNWDWALAETIAANLLSNRPDHAGDAQ